MDENENGSQASGDQDGSYENQNAGSAETNDSSSNQNTVPYDRFKETIEEKNNLKGELAVMREQLARLTAQQNPRTEDPQIDLSNIDENTRKYINSIEQRAANAIGNISYELEKSKHIQTEPGLRKYEKEIDQYCIDYRRKYGMAPAVEAAVEIVKARHMDEIRRKPAPSPAQATQKPKATPSATNTATPPKPIKKGLLNIPL